MSRGDSECSSERRPCTAREQEQAGERERERKGERGEEKDEVRRNERDGTMEPDQPVHVYNRDTRVGARVCGIGESLEALATLSALHGA